ncbi:hypothetical protein PAHAL_2G496700 [Panicum hallii]|uniref:Uncharacterized protein n=1 Tax=Panicum hallii TaxID=206008 RepID=A0A2S3H589_9POAL|nr:hypothetical protein PAHAL_2G496700 [Panicum hallii]
MHGLTETKSPACMPSTTSTSLPHWSNYKVDSASKFLSASSTVQIRCLPMNSAIGQKIEQNIYSFQQERFVHMHLAKLISSGSLCGEIRKTLQTT